MSDTITPADPIAMLAFHRALRRDLRRTRTLDADYPGRWPNRVRVGRRLRWVVEQLRWHHEGEDIELWPLLHARDPHLGPDLAAMEREHTAIDGPLAAFDRAAHGLITGWCDEQSVLRALDELEPGLLAHLDHEEQALLPHITRLLDQAEWDGFQQRGWIRGATPVQALEFITWITDGTRWSRAEAERLGFPWFAYRFVRQFGGGGHCLRPGDPWRGTRAAAIGP
ncbi:hemerythrin domain-containing protein [Gordonia sp. HY442]|uniref:hemerythrin domain-containing protein n=1 Tax=Gordonia zhenghanii TaxID=2911516 RepID=UPI001F1CE2B8|nr:hemerythrin domain-containing protein [Gordonia zhenghanii]MCF8603122.1 hemerythrin domain-containing protein [Gordonia zhenghanii]